MKIFGSVKFNANASFFKRFLSFFIDATVSGFIKLFVLQYIFFSRSKDIFLNFFETFGKVFPNLEVNDLQSIHIRYMTSSKAYEELFIILLSLLTTTLVYRLINYICFKKTLGQKMLGINVINNKDQETSKINIFQAISRAFLEFLPGATIFVMVFLMPFNFLNFHRYVVSDSGLVQFFTKLVKFSNIESLFTFIFIYILFWFNIFFFSNRFFLHDILTNTRVVDTFLIREEESMEKRLVNKIDKVIDKLKEINKHCFSMIKDLTKKVFKKCKKS